MLAPTLNDEELRNAPDIHAIQNRERLLCADNERFDEIGILSVGVHYQLFAFQARRFVPGRRAFQLSCGIEGLPDLFKKVSVLSPVRYAELEAQSSD